MLSEGTEKCCLYSQHDAAWTNVGDGTEIKKIKQLIINVTVNNALVSLNSLHNIRPLCPSSDHKILNANNAGYHFKFTESKNTAIYITKFEFLIVNSLKKAVKTSKFIHFVRWLGLKLCQEQK